MTPTCLLLRELISIPSVNPAFLPPRDPHAGEKNVGDFLAATAAQAGLDIEFQEVFPHRSNLLARLTPRERPRHRILLAPHLDTVGGSPLHDALFQPVLRAGRWYGRGACDTKGSVAAMMSALVHLAKAGRRPAQTEIVFVGLVDEEQGQCGSRALAARGLAADLAIVGEPTRLRVVTAHKGDVWLRLETRGKSAHGARPELGRNAVHEMARIVDRLETDYAQQLRRRRHPVLGHATINVGSIAGGSQPNIVPDRCSISADRRTLPGENVQGVFREIRAFLRGHQLKARLIDAKAALCVPLETDPGLPFVRRFLECAGQSEGVGVDFFCDAAILASGGIPSVVFGPGDIAQAHTAEEWISVGSLERATNLLIRFLESLP